MSDKKTPETEIVEVGFGTSKTVQPKQFEPVKKFVNIVVANPADVPLTGAAMFALGEKMIDDAFRADGIDPSNPTEVKREIIKAGQGKKGKELQKRQKRRAPRPIEERTEVIHKTPESFAAQREHNFKRVDEDPEGWRKVEDILEKLKADEGKNYPKSVAHVKWLRSKKIISYKEYKLLMAWSDVLQLPEKVPKRVQVVNVEDVIKTKKIHSMKEAGFLRAKEELSFPEYQAISRAHEEQGEAIFVITT